jgi:hypothetical protein
MLRKSEPVYEQDLNALDLSERDLLPDGVQSADLSPEHRQRLKDYLVGFPPDVRVRVSRLRSLHAVEFTTD